MKYILQLGNGQTATIDYSLGGSVEEDNQVHLDNTTLRQMNSFHCASTLTVTLSANMAKPLEFGFIANVISSERIGYYNSSKKTKITISVPIQCLDGDGTEAPFAVAPTFLPMQAGSHTLNIAYHDHPFCMFPLQDDEAPNEGKTLLRVDGHDVHKVWLAVGNPLDSGLSLLGNIGWMVDWFASIDKFSGKVELVPDKNGAGLQEIPAPANPIYDGQLASTIHHITTGKWA